MRPGAAGPVGLVNIMGGAINARRAMREQFPSMRVLERERPSHPEQVALRAACEALHGAPAGARSEVADADAFILRMKREERDRRDIERRIAADRRDRAMRLARVAADVEEQIAAYAARKSRESGAGGES